MGGSNGVRLLATALMAATVIAADVPDVRLTPEVAVNDTSVITRTFEAPAVAVDPEDPGLAYVAAGNLQTRTCHVFRSTNGGGSFEQLEGPEFGRLTDCGLNRGDISKNIRFDLHVDREGVLYWVAALADPEEVGPRSIMLFRSSDQGTSWSSTMVVEAEAPADPVDAVANFEPDLYVEPFGEAPRTVWVSWRRSFTGESERPTEGWAARSTDGGESFGEPVRAIEANPGFDSPKVVTTEDGDVVWFQRTRPPQPEDEGAQAPAPELLMARSENGGDSWEETALRVQQDVIEAPQAAVSPDGRTLYLVWADDRNGDLDIMFMRSTDGGDSWSDPLRLNEDDVGNARSQKWPRVQVGPDGRVGVAWYDYRHDLRDVPEDDVEFFLGDLNDVYYAVSEDDGVNFSADLRATSVSINRRIGTYNSQFFVEVPPGIGLGAGNTLLAWSGTRLGDSLTSAQDIYASAFVPARTRTTPPVALGLALLLLGAGLALVGVTWYLRRRGAPSESARRPGGHDPRD